MNNKKESSKCQVKERDEFNLYKDFIAEEMERAISYTRNRSSPGLDGIEYEMIKRLPTKYKSELLKIMNYCYKEGVMIRE